MDTVSPMKNLLLDRILESHSGEDLTLKEMELFVLAILRGIQVRSCEDFFSYCARNFDLQNGGTNLLGIPGKGNGPGTGLGDTGIPVFLHLKKDMEMEGDLESARSCLRLNDT